MANWKHGSADSAVGDEICSDGSLALRSTLGRANHTRV